MGKLEFHSNAEPTMGVELELGLIDTRDMSLSSSIQLVLDQLKDKSTATNYKPELMQCCVEINTGICRTVDAAEQDLRGKLIELENIELELTMVRLQGQLEQRNSMLNI